MSRFRLWMAVGLLMAAAACAPSSQAPSPAAQDPAADELPVLPIGGDFTLTDQDNQPFTLSSLKGKVVLIFFGYTMCPDACPTTLSKLSTAYSRLTDEERGKVKALYITIDPERDTPQVMKDHLTYFGVDALGLTGKVEGTSEVAGPPVRRALREVDREDRGRLPDVAHRVDLRARRPGPDASAHRLRSQRRPRRQEHPPAARRGLSGRLRRNTAFPRGPNRARVNASNPSLSGRRSVSMVRSTLAWMLAAASLVAARPAAAQTSVPVKLQFEALVAGKPFSCAEKYADIGTTRSSITLTDFRFYISRVRLVRADGAEVPVTLEQDGLWQHENVALLDFEDGNGPCASGTPELRSFIEGRVPQGEYRGVRFDLGVPFELNHREPTVAPSPLNLTRLFWSWNAGYKFARIDMRTTGQPKGWVIHLGSTGCEPGGPPSVVPISCKHPNRAAVELTRFSADRDVIQFDLGRLLAEANVDVNQEKTAMGCMSGRDDQECGPVLRALGLADGATQTVFTVRGGATAAARER